MLGAGKWKTLADVELKREKKVLKNHIGNGLEIIFPFPVLK